MNVAALKKTEILRELSLIPDNKLDSVRMYIDSILKESKQLAKSNRSLKGIWRNKGFENIADLEAEIKQARKQLSSAILSRQL
ncbi:MAG: hypothetical protein ONB46_08635 [candidate division KSB1 bacterium]|nr:hypothetical protein [candidate division KSB1 bacterium]MDZ7365911.1 hypothetical protein [candidate division KSB1 bacterium]MDZ7403855.1 hypothetical protein [candidate division KSB1 bacterium]